MGPPPQSACARHALGSCNNINLLKQQEHALALDVDLPNRNKVPQLEFGGIGFSFNEHSNKNTGKAPVGAEPGEQERILCGHLQAEVPNVCASRTLSASNSQSDTSKRAFATTKILNGRR